MSSDLLFELGTEDIPPGYLPDIAENFESLFREKLDEARLGFEEIKTYYTPRRLAYRVVDLQDVQADRIEKHRGPSKSVGLDEDGEYTIAARKFAEGKGGTEEDLFLEDTEEGTYFFVEEKIEGSNARDLLQDILNSVVKEVDQPERMRWNGSSIKFIRPIRWIVCLLGDEKLDLRIGGISSSNETRGHRLHGDPRIELEDLSQYEVLLEENYVIPDPGKRKDRLKSQLDEMTGELGVRPAVDDEFIDLLANSLEYPNPVSGNFPEDFLNLPDELLFKTLTGEARLVPLVGLSGVPVNSFIGFRDGGDKGGEGVRKGYESVINARLRDSKFFFSHDREESLETYLEDLKTVTFQEKLGSIWDKVQRMRKIADEFTSDRTDFDRELCERTVSLCKADLVTEVVDEFPSLEGTIGGYYAELDGEPEEVVRGIKEHYQPRTSSDVPPESSTGIVASIADKLDTLTGSFLIGEEPSGTRDPYGLRRKADGIIRTMIERKVSANMGDLLRYSGEMFELEGGEEATDKLERYFRERLDRVLELSYEVPYDVVNAIDPGEELDFYDAYLRATSLEGFKERPEMKNLVDSFTRLVNITGDRSRGEVDRSLFELPEEEELWKEVTGKEERLGELLRKKSYQEMIHELLELKDPIDRYFDNVMVMADEEDLRKNRLNFLLYVKEIFLQLGDLSEIVTE